MNKLLFEEEISKIERGIRTIEALNAVNIHLQKKNLILLHPYSQGGDIKVIKKLLTETTEPDKEVFSFFARKFFDLISTISFIEGFYITRPFLKDYVPVIRESLALCLQKDFRGAIYTLIPVIEGTLRKYIIHKKGNHKEKEIDIKELLKALNILSNDYVEQEKIYLRSRNQNFINSNNYLDSNQEKQILKRHKYYFDLWMIQFKNFIENNLYLNTKENIITDRFNRHLIFHALDDNIEYSFGNYLRVFNSINYLSWAIGNTTEGCSIFSVANEVEVKSKWVDYLNILIASEALTEYKQNIYSEPIESFSKYIDIKQLKVLKEQENLIKSILKMNNFLKS